MASYPHRNEPNAQNKNCRQNNDVDVNVKQQPTTHVETQQHAIISIRLHQAARDTPKNPRDVFSTRGVSGSGLGLAFTVIDVDQDCGIG